MTLILDILPTAQEDAENAQDWYEEAAPGLGDAFTETYLATVDMLANMPGMGSRRFAYLHPGIDLRTWTLDRFPFRIFYAVHGDTLRVYRVCHQRRNVVTSLLS